MCGVQWQGCSSRPWWQALAPRTGMSLLRGFQYCHQKYGSPSGPPTPRFLLVSLMLMDVTCSPPPAHCCYSRSPPPTRSAPSSRTRCGCWRGRPGRAVPAATPPRPAPRCPTRCWAASDSHSTPPRSRLALRQPRLGPAAAQLLPGVVVAHHVLVVQPGQQLDLPVQPAVGGPICRI